MERQWEGKRAILHADLDCFFASVEVLDNPQLKGLPIIVGGTGPRGVVAAASYEARVWGVRSAMPMSQARRLCQNAVVLGVSYARYAEVSKQFHNLLHRFTDEIEPIGLDEAFMDVSGCARLFGPPRLIASQIRDLVSRELKLSACVGVGTSKQVAKLASRRAKPTVVNGKIEPPKGIVVVWPGHEQEFLDPLSVRELWGVGPKTYERLKSVGVTRIKDLRMLPDSTLAQVAGRTGSRLGALARGIDTNPVESRSQRKSLGHEQTYPVDLNFPNEVDRELVRLADQVAARAGRTCVAGKTLSLKIRFADFQTITRSVTLPSPTNSKSMILKHVRKLVPEDACAKGIRLLGVSLSGLLLDGPRQLTLDEGITTERQNAISQSVEAIRERYGTRAIAPASLLERDDLKEKRQFD